MTKEAALRLYEETVSMAWKLYVEYEAAARDRLAARLAEA